MSYIDVAVESFKSGNTCSQAIFSTYATQFGISREMALKIACPFGGGMARLGETCGAVTGAFLVFGLKYGRIYPEDEKAKEKTYSLVREFVEKFKSRNDTIKCNDLLGYKIDTPEGHQQAKEKGLFDTVCPKFVKDAAEILEEML